MSLFSVICLQLSPHFFDRACAPEDIISGVLPSTIPSQIGRIERQSSLQHHRLPSNRLHGKLSPSSEELIQLWGHPPDPTHRIQFASTMPSDIAHSQLGNLGSQRSHCATRLIGFVDRKQPEGTNTNTKLITPTTQAAEAASRSYSAQEVAQPGHVDEAVEAEQNVPDVEEDDEPEAAESRLMLCLSFITPASTSFGTAVSGALRELV
ncbi:hypothetical protein P154DRAFT_569177 [Amniculicola lignicola CBS 123094]|uniref:Uncharacterized protein n=1 Tax=Amniculicola lignicola CBS 123094 TaxID=1392246 RepID=A0A6A5WZZ5_9PLEO|nr:hypothetical protein P154DRAFT_569177 [Amniculicola lignicola CBS 123094]